MKKSKIIKILKGQKALNAYGLINIQYNKEAEEIFENGYCLINCNKAYTQEARVDWIENNEFCSTGVISRTKAIKFIQLKFKKDKIILKGLKKYNIDKKLVLENLMTNGYTGAYIITQILKGNKPKDDKIESMKIAKKRHLLTSYDSINKKSMNDYEVRELRRSANHIII